MRININCRKIRDGIYCKDTRVKRSLFGIGPRMCLEIDGKRCPYREPHTKPPLPRDMG